MRMEVIEEFVLFSRHLNMSKAAREANVSQPSFSEHMASLESEVGAELITRNGSKLELTSAGEEFLKHAQIALAKYREGIEKARQAAKRGRPVRICSNFPIRTNILAFLKKNEIEFKVIDIGFNESPIAFIEKGGADIGIAIDLRKSQKFVREMEQAGIESFTVLDGEPLSLSMSKGHPLASRERLFIDDLKGMVLLSNIGYLFDAYKANLLDAFEPGFPIEIRLEPISSMSDLAFADPGDGIHICGKETFEQYQSNRDDIVVFEGLEDAEFKMDMTCLHRKNEASENVLATLRVLGSLSEQ